MLLLLACTAANPQRPDTSDTGTTSTATRCTLDPALASSPARLRVAGDGAVWIVDDLGVLARYARVEGEDCSLTGALVPNATDEFESVSDIAIDAAGDPWSLVFFDELRRLGADGVAEVSCAVTAGHTLAVGEDRAWVWGVGEETLYEAELTADGCVASADTLTLDQPISPTARYSSRGLAAAAFDAGNTLAPGYLIDLATGATTAEIGNGTLSTGDELAAIADIYVTGSGYVVVDGFSALWSIDDSGAVIGMAEMSTLLPIADGDDESPVSLDYAGGDQYYLATTTFDAQAVWLIDL